MHYRRLGSTGLQLSALSFGAWVTFGKQIGRSEARNLIAAAWDNGINFFDNAEVYARGRAEEVMGDVIGDLRLPRDGYCVSSKVFFGAVDDPRPTQRGLSRKHVTDACHAALRRLRVDYLDLYFCHRPDPDTPIQETVRAMDALIRQGKVLYWGTSEWSAEQLRTALEIAAREHLHAPAMEQRNCRLLVIDSLNGYLSSMPQEKQLMLQMHELLSYLNQSGVTTFLINPQHGLVGTMSTGNLNISYMADTVILFRFFEAQGRIRKALSVIKNRSGAHEDAIRELRIGNSGIRLSAPLNDFHGVLTGTPHFIGDEAPLLGNDLARR